MSEIIHLNFSRQVQSGTVIIAPAKNSMAATWRFLCAIAPPNAGKPMLPIELIAKVPVSYTPPACFCGSPVRVNPTGIGEGCATCHLSFFFNKESL